MLTQIIVWTSLIVLFGIWFQIALNRRMQRFFGRGCMGREWRTQFPTAKKEEIRDFLQLFTEAFAVSSKKKLSLSPNDRVMDVYRTIYPIEGSADALEYETLVMECEARYGVDLSVRRLDNPTIGEIFSAVQKRS